MIDDKTPEVPVVPPVPAPAPEPTLPAPVVDSKMGIKPRQQAEYYARHPEELADVLGELERAGHIETTARIEKLELELALRDSASKHGLAEEDYPFIKGGTKEEIETNATAYKARLDSLKPGAEGGAGKEVTEIEVKKIGQPLEPVNAPPPIKETVRGGDGVTSIEAANAELAKSLEGVSYT